MRKLMFGICFLTVGFARAQSPWLIKDINSAKPVNQWSDGTVFGMADAMIKSPDGAPGRMFLVNNAVLFFADDGKGSRGLWRSDGTSAGTYFLHAIDYTTSQIFYVPDNACTDGHLLYFERIDLQNTSPFAKELWRSDGTVTGTYAVFSGNSQGIITYTDVPIGASIGNNFFFVGLRQSARGDSLYRCIYKTDGSVTGTRLYYSLDSFAIGNTFGFNGQAGVGISLIGFDNRIFICKDGKIWWADGNNPFQPLPNLPGADYEIVNQWVNVDNKYLAITLFPTPKAADNYDRMQLISLQAGQNTPVILGDYLSSTGLPYLYLPLLGQTPEISGDKLFFYTQQGYPYTGNGQPLLATNGSPAGTFQLNFTVPPKSHFAVWPNYGVNHQGLLFSLYPYLHGQQFWLWDGTTPNTSKALTILNDSLQNLINEPTAVYFFGDTLLLTGGDGLVQADLNNTYCYHVEYVYPQAAPVFYNNEFLGFGNAEGGETADVGNELFHIRPFKHLWTGNVSSNWNTSANWLDGQIPTPSDDVVIPPTKNNPVIDGEAFCNNLTVNSNSILSIHKQSNLTVEGYVANYGDYFNPVNLTMGIIGAGAVTRTGSSSNHTYGLGPYNIDTLIIDGKDMELTDVATIINPPNFDFNTIIHFKKGKLIGNYTRVNMLKSPYFTGADSARYMVTNRKDNSLLVQPNPAFPVYFSIGGYLTNSAVDSVAMVPVGTSVHSFSPATFSKTSYTYSITKNDVASLTILDSASRHGNNSFGSTVNKTWQLSEAINFDTLRLSWIAADQSPGFNTESCYIACYNGTTWIKSPPQNSTLTNGVYTSGPFNLRLLRYPATASFIVASSPCSASVLTAQPANDSLCTNGKALFFVSASNATGYQWQLNNNGNWSNLLDTGSYRGSHSDSLTISPVAAYMDKNNYRCLISNSCTNVTSASASLHLTPALNPAVSINSDQQNICKGTTVNFIATAVNGGSSPVLQWLVNGKNAGINSASYSTAALLNGDVVSCTLVSNSDCILNKSAVSNNITISVSSTLQPALTISGSASNICAGHAVTFTASPVNTGPNPVFLWEVNGVRINESASQIILSTLTNGDVVSCKVVGSSDCVTSDTALSNSITIMVSPLLQPSITITSSVNNSCAGTPVNFNAAITNGGSQPAYQWLVNNVMAGSNSASFSSSVLHTGDIVSCHLKSDLSCATSAEVTSNNIIMQINSVDDPALTIAASANNICADSTVIFLAHATNAGASPSFQWQLNGTNVGINADQFTSSQLHNGDVINCIISSGSACISTVSATSPVTMTVYPSPHIAKSIPVTIYAGNSVELKPSISGEVMNYLWLPDIALSANTIANPVATPQHTIVYTLIAASAYGCTDTAIYIVDVLDDLNIPNAFSPNADGINDFWQISFLRNLYTCTVDIYDRYGQQLYHSVGYTKPWDGTCKGHPLPVGTYYYVIDPKNGKKSVAGSVTIIK